MRRCGRSCLAIAVATVLFVGLAPWSVDLYNSICHRAFMDLVPQGNPYALARGAELSYESFVWPFDFAYPPLTMILLLPGWLVFQLTHSEWLYQTVFKLPLFASAVATQCLAVRMAREGGRTPLETPLVTLYVLLPGVLLETTVAGCLEAPNALLILLAVFWFNRRPRASALALGAAGALRLFPMALLPVFLLRLGQEGGQRSRRILTYGLLATAPLVLSFTPFLATDARAFVSFLGGMHMIFGPFATLNIVATPARLLAAVLGHHLDYQTVGYPFLPLTVAALAGTYAWIARHRSALARDCLLTLLVFFLVYPKGHGLYIGSLVPLALLEPMGAVTWVWLPGTLWALTVNGTFGATGIAYWFGPLTGSWRRVASGLWAPALSSLLAAAQAGLILCALRQLHSRVLRGPAPALASQRVAPEPAEGTPAC